MQAQAEKDKRPARRAATYNFRAPAVRIQNKGKPYNKGAQIDFTRILLIKYHGANNSYHH
jgi:hypothetical protein